MVTVTTWKNFISTAKEKTGLDWALLLAPVVTPLMPASTYIAGMINASRESMGGWAIVPAFASGAGMEITGALSAYAAYNAIRRKDWFSAALAIAALFAYAALANWGISSLGNSEMFQAMIWLSVVCNLVVSIVREKIDRAKDEQLAHAEAVARKHQEHELQMEQLRLDRERAEIEAQLKQAEAQAKQAEMLLQLQIERQHTKQVKLSNGRSGVRVSKDEQTNRRGRSLDPERLKLVREYMAAHAGEVVTVRQVCEACKISSTDTASRYMDAAK